MIIKGASRRSVKFWAKHLTNRTENDRAELIEARGFLSDQLGDMMQEIMDDAAAMTRCRNALYVASFSPTIDERLNAQQWERALEIFEKERGIPEGQRRIVYEHEKTGRVHRHVVWDRIDPETLTAFHDSQDWKACARASHEISQELDLHHTPGILFREPNTARPERNPEAWEMFRGMHSKISPQDMKAEVTALYRSSADGPDFAARLQNAGYLLCQGDRRDFLILDAAGHDHSLARRVSDVKAKDLREFMSGIDRARLPTLAEARQLHQQRTVNAHVAELTSVTAEIALEEKRLAAPLLAIDKKLAADFAQMWMHDPERFEKQRQGIATRIPALVPEIDQTIFDLQGQQQPQPQTQETASPAEQKQPTERGLNATAAAIRLAYTLSDSAAGFRQNLADSGLTLACVTQQEAERSRRHAAFAKEVGRFAPEYRQGEFVAMNERGHIYGLNNKTTGNSRDEIEKFMGTLPAGMDGIDAVQRQQEAARAERAEQRKLDRLRNERPLNETAASIRLAYNLSNTPQDFVRNLAERDLALARPGEDEAERSRTRAAFAKEIGHFAAEYRSDDYVAVNRHGQVYVLNQRTTGESRAEIDAFLGTLDATQIRSIAATQQRLGTEKPLQADRTEAVRNLTELDIRLAYKSTDNAIDFAAALKDRGIVLAVATKDDAEKSSKQAEAAKAQGRFPNATGFRENETVAVDPRGHVYRFSERVTGSRFGDMQAYLRNLERKEMHGIEFARHSMRYRADEDYRENRKRDKSARALLGIGEIFDAGYSEDKHLKSMVLDRTERRTIENERAQERSRNTRDS